MAAACVRELCCTHAPQTRRLCHTSQTFLLLRYIVKATVQLVREFPLFCPQIFEFLTCCSLGLFFIQLNCSFKVIIFKKWVLYWKINFNRQMFVHFLFILNMLLLNDFTHLSILFYLCEKFQIID